MSGGLVAVDAVGHPLSFPRGKNTPVRSGPSNQAFGSNAPLTILHRPAGTRGVVKTNQIVMNKTIDDLWKVNLAIWYDGADPATDTATADVNLSLASICGYEMSHQTQGSAQHLIGWLYDPNAPSTASKANSGQVDSRFFSVTVGGNIWGSQGISIQLRWPKPFTNGITIQLVPAAGYFPSMWTNCMYQDGMPNSWNSNLRWLAQYNEADIAIRDSGTGWACTSFKINTTPVTANGKTYCVGTKVGGAAFTNALIGTVISDQNVDSGNIDHDILVVDFIDANNLALSLVDCSHGVVNNGTLGTRIDFVNSHTLLNLANGAGYVQSVFLTMLSNVTNRVTASPGNPLMYEANLRMFLDGNYDSDLTFGGVEDFAESALYWDNAQQTPQFWRSGVMCIGTDPPEVSFYRHFDEDLLRFQKGMQILLPNTGATGAAPTRTMKQTRMASAVPYYLET